jgi:hypothetical protein
MAKIAIYVVCYKCNGAGIYYQDTLQGIVEEDPCPVCQGAKYLPVQYVELTDFGLDDLSDRLDDILDKCNDIIEKLKRRRFNGLSKRNT